MANEMQEKGKAGILALICSFLFPILVLSSTSFRRTR